MSTDSTTLLDDVEAFEIIDVRPPDPLGASMTCSCLTSACFACNLTD